MRTIAHQKAEEDPRPWTRISKPAYDEANAELKRRISNNTPSPGTRDSLRRWIAAMENGQPNYEEMSPALAAAAREQWPRTKVFVQKLGPLHSLTFERVAPNGSDTYAATFAHGTVEIMMPLSPQTGKSLLEVGTFYRESAKVCA